MLDKWSYFFQKRVEAISKCGIRDSLKEVDVKYNQTLNKSKVLVIFNELGIPQVFVVKTVSGSSSKKNKTKFNTFNWL